MTEPNCLYGAIAYNRHDNCPYSLMCAVCDLEEDAVSVSEGADGS